MPDQITQTMAEHQEAIEAKLESCNESKLSCEAKQSDKVDNKLNNMVGSPTNSSTDSDSAISLADASSLSVTSHSPPTSRSSYCSSSSASVSVASIDGDGDRDDQDETHSEPTPIESDKTGETAASDQLQLTKVAKQSDQWCPEQQRSNRPYAPGSAGTRSRLPHQSQSQINSNYFYQADQRNHNIDNNHKSYHNHQYQSLHQQQAQFYNNHAGYHQYHYHSSPQVPLVVPPAHHQRFITNSSSNNNINPIASHAFYTSDCFHLQSWTDASDSGGYLVHQHPIQRTAAGFVTTGQQQQIESMPAPCGYLETMPFIPYGLFYKNNNNDSASSNANYYHYNHLHNYNYDHYTRSYSDPNQAHSNIAPHRSFYSSTKPVVSKPVERVMSESPDIVASDGSSDAATARKFQVNNEDSNDDNDGDCQDSCCSECQSECSDADCQVKSTSPESSLNDNDTTNSTCGSEHTDTTTKRSVESVMKPSQPQARPRPTTTTSQCQPAEYLSVIPASQFQVIPIAPVGQHVPYAFTRPFVGYEQQNSHTLLAPLVYQPQGTCGWQVAPQMACQLDSQQQGSADHLATYMATGQLGWYPETVFVSNGGNSRPTFQMQTASPLAASERSLEPYLELMSQDRIVCPKDTRQLTQDLVGLLPIEAMRTQVCQAYGMDEVWQEEFEKLFNQLMPGVVFWHLIEVESNPTINSTDNILAYRGHYIIDGCSQLVTRQDNSGEEEELEEEGETEDQDSGCDATAEANEESQTGSHQQQDVVLDESKVTKLPEATKSATAGEDPSELDTRVESFDDAQNNANNNKEPPDEVRSNNSCHGDNITVRVEDELLCVPNATSLSDFKQQFPTKFRMFIDSAKVRFCCDECGHGWTSMKGRVVFWYELFEVVCDTKTATGDEKTPQSCGSNSKLMCNTWPIDPAAPNKIVGYCAYKLFGQQCDVCKIENRFERPMWYPEEVVKVLNNVHNKIGQIYFGFKMPAIDKQRRAGKPKTSHNSSLCQACSDGVCTSRK